MTMRDERTTRHEPLGDDRTEDLENALENDLGNDLELIVDYLSGDLTPAAAAAVRARCASDPEFAASMRRMEIAWATDDDALAGAASPSTVTPDPTRLWRRVEALDPTHVPPGVIPSQSTSAILYDRDGAPIEPVVATVPTRHPSTPPATRGVGRVLGAIRHTPPRRIAAVAAGALVIAAATPATWPWWMSVAAMVGIAKNDTSALHDMDLVSQRTPPGQRTGFALRDQTNIELAGASQVRYPNPFGGAHRELWLTGRAYITVPAVRNDGSVAPLVVHMGTATVTVPAGDGAAFEIGDRTDEGESGFDVRSDRGDILVRATPATSAPHDSAWTVIPGNRAIVQNGQITVAPSSISGSISWRGIDLSFVAVPLRDVIRELNRWYPFTFVLRGSSAEQDQLVSLTSMDLDAKEIAKLLADRANLESRQEGKTFTFSPQTVSP